MWIVFESNLKDKKLPVLTLLSLSLSKNVALMKPVDIFVHKKKLTVIHRTNYNNNLIN